jgi:type III secretion protein R
LSPLFIIRICLLIGALFIFETPIFAQNNGKALLQQMTNPAHPPMAPEGDLGAGYPDLTSQAALLIFLALLPFLIMLFTSFIKITITLALLRSALGVQQTPPNQIINGIAFIISIYVMYPTGLEMYHRAEPIIKGQTSGQLFSAKTANLAIEVIDAAKEPLRQFLVRNSRKQDLQGFYKIAYKTFPDEAKQTLKETDFLVVAPAFITTQIRAAFEIGVLIYLPFFVIDLVTSNILLAMQMMMLSPLSISLPLKLLLVVMIDGWTLLVQGLALSFN